ncbi:hypothetical protein [Parabacteroides sp. PF5-6]|uniref:hypothetical protein n=1 Tax=Parabacteroides sp. PF5-6 TaxID=1742403 RepID=UPI002405BFC8|nr:hypothetical protein [Parabacteroides sp. PF5-6]MDF9830176.1 hypothetical protein [Parabacteroides sp. PF5-6]
MVEKTLRFGRPKCNVYFGQPTHKSFYPGLHLSPGRQIPVLISISGEGLEEEGGFPEKAGRVFQKAAGVFQNPGSLFSKAAGLFREGLSFFKGMPLPFT